MKRQHREVNIFNMSLLDILCGALGAFCFMMLALFPDHLRVRELEARAAQQGDAASLRERAEKAEREADLARAEQTLAYFQIHWAGPQDVDIWLQMPRGKWVVPKGKLADKRQLYGETHDETKGPAREQAWITDVAYDGARYRLFAKLHAANGADLHEPLPVRGFIAARVHAGGDKSRMSVIDVTGQLARAGELVELGSVLFAAENYEITMGPLPAPVPTPPKP